MSGQKFGRHKRGESMAAYKAASRWVANKERRMLKHKKQMEKAAKKAPLMVPHGTARAIRRSKKFPQNIKGSTK